MAVEATRSTCLRRAVGCVLTDAASHVLGRGYNGVASGELHCNEKTPPSWGWINGTIPDHPHACPGAREPSGTGLDGCHAVHAEQNALLRCRDVERIDTCYVSCAPCVTCVKLLMNTPCRRIVFAEPYAHDAASRALWEKHGRVWEQWNGA